MTPWEGRDRRDEDRDHDLLTKIDANLSNFMSRFDSHIEADSDQFKELTKKTDNLAKYIWMGVGALSAIQFIIVKFFAK